MTIQSLSLQPTHLLERNDLWSSPLGNVGNLRYSTERGGTPSVSFPRAVWAVASRTVGYCAFRLTCPSEQASETRLVRTRAYYNSLLCGNLLGYLTARPQDDLHGHSKIVQWFAQASRLSSNDLSKLVGWRYSLSTYMSELTDADIRALRDGILSSPSAKAAVLNQVSRDRNDPSRQLASQMLGQIERELQQRLARDSARIR